MFEDIISLSTWLIVVALLRLLSVVIGYISPQTFASSVFPAAPKSEVTDLMGRTFAIWTTVTCTLCLLTAQDPDPESPIFFATFLSFVYALLFFAIELLFYGTMTFRSIASPGIVSTLSIVWMGAEMLA